MADAEEVKDTVPAEQGEDKDKDGVKDEKVEGEGGVAAAEKAETGEGEEGAAEEGAEENKEEEGAGDAGGDAQEAAPAEAEGGDAPAEEGEKEQEEEEKKEEEEEKKEGEGGDAGEQDQQDGDAPAETAEETEAGGEAQAEGETEAEPAAAGDDAPDEAEKAEDEPAAEDKDEEEEEEEEEEKAADEEEEEAAPEEEEGEEKSAVELTDEEREKCRQIFERKAVNGRLDLKGFKVLFRLMGEVLSSEDAEQMFNDGDKDDNGTIDFDEFCRLYSKFSEEETTRKAALMESIDKLFPNSDGQPVELKKVEKLLLKFQQPDLDMRLAREKSDLGAEDVRYLVRSMDKDGNGLISKDEFVDTLCKHLEP